MAEGFRIGKAIIEIRADDSKYREDLRRLQKETKNTEADISVGANTLFASRQIALAARDRMVLLHAKVTGLDGVEAAFARLSGVRAVSTWIEDIGKSVGNLDKNLPQMAKLAVGVTTLSAAALSATKNLLTIGGSIASIVPAALALPGIFGGFAVGVGVTAAALVDMKEVLGDLGPVFGNLQDQISANFWNQAAQPIRRMVYDLLPQLENGLGKVSTSLGKFFGRAADMTRMSLAGDVLNKMMNNLAKSIDVAANALEPMIDSIVLLGSHGSEYLPRLAQWFVDINEQFNDFLTAAEKDGSLTRWTENGIDALGDLGRVIANTSTIFYGLYEAAKNAGGAGLGELADGLKNISDIVNSEPFQGSLTTIFIGAGYAMDGVAESGTELMKTFESMAPVINRVLQIGGRIAGDMLSGIAVAFRNPVFQGGLVDFFLGVERGVSKVIPVLPQLAGHFGTFLTVAGNVAELLGGVFAVAVEELGPSFDNLMGAITPVAEVLSGWLITALRDLGPVLQDITQKIEDFSTKNPELAAGVVAAAGAVALLAGGIGRLAGAFGGMPSIEGITASFAGLSGVTTGLAAAASWLLGPWGRVAFLFGAALLSSEELRTALGDLGTAFEPLTTSISEGLSPVLEALGDLFLVIVEEGIAPLITAIAETLTPVIQDLAPLVSDTFKEMEEGIRDSTEIISGIIETFTALLQGDWDAFWQSMTDTVTKFGDMQEEDMNETMTSLGSIMSGAWGLMVEQTNNNLTRIQEDFNAKFGGIALTVATKLVEIQTNMGVAFEVMRSIVVTKVAEIVSTVSTGFETARSLVVTKLAEMGSSVVSGFTNMAMSALSGMASLRSNVVSGMAGAAASVVSGMANMRSQAISGFAGMVSSAISGMANLRGQVISGMAGAVSSVISGMSNMRGQAISGFAGMVSSAISGMANIRSQVISGMAGAVSSVISGFSNMRANAASGVANVVSQVATLPGRITGALGNLGGLLVGAGQQVVQGMISGIQGMVGSLASTAANMAKTALDAAKGALGIKSPSREFMAVGRFSGEGMIKGMDAMQAKVMRSAENMVHLPEATLSASTMYEATVAPMMNGVAGSSASASNGIIGTSGNTTNHYNTTVELNVQMDDIDDVKKLVGIVRSVEQTARAGSGQSTQYRKF